MSGELALNTTEQLSTLTLKEPQTSAAVAATQRRINETVATRKVQEEMNKLLAIVVINSAYVNLRSAKLQ